MRIRNIKITAEYDGANYHGWQRQKNALTIQQLLEEAIGSVTGENVTVMGAGRTDARVHARNQSAHFKITSLIGTRNLLLGINSLLPKDVVVKELKEMNEAFHARFDVKSKVYMYQIYNAPVRSALYRDYAWHVRAPLDLEKMEECFPILKGTHDFSSFCGKKEGDVDCVRTIKDLYIKNKDPEKMRIFIEADGFLRYMARSIVGTMVEIGMGRRMPRDLSVILGARERGRAGITAPPHGLFLVEVKY